MFYVIIGFLGAVGIGDAVWLVSDIGNALMAIPNIIMVLAFSVLSHARLSTISTMAILMKCAKTKFP